MRIVVSLLVALCVVGSVHPVWATVIPIGPFTGALTEDFSSIGNGNNYNYWSPSYPQLPTPLPIMGGNASLYGRYEIAGGASFRFLSNPFDEGEGNAPFAANIVFDTPVVDFGAYWHTDAPLCPAGSEVCLGFTVKFLDTAGGVFYQEFFHYEEGPWDVMNGYHTFVWRGWTSSVPIASIDWGYTSGHYVQIAGLQADPIPEPSTLLLFSTGVVGLAGCLWRRKQRMEVSP